MSVQNAFASPDSFSGRPAALEEGEVGAGDEIVRVIQGPEGMTVAEVNALLYKPGHPADRLARALRIPALSTGWRDSFNALLEQARSPGATTGNAGLGRIAGPTPAWVGFRPLRVTGKTRESNTVTSLQLEPADGRSLAAGLPEQFAVLRLQQAPDAPPLLRSYSLSGEPSEARYRISVKRNAGGVAGTYIADWVRPGDVIEMTAPRGGFTLQPGDGPVVFHECRNRRDTCACYAACAGRCKVTETGLVAARCARPWGAPVC